MVAILTIELDSAVCRGNQYRARPWLYLSGRPFITPQGESSARGWLNKKSVIKMYPRLWLFKHLALF